MNEEMKKQLECINANLNTIAFNQAILYAELKRIESLFSKLDKLKMKKTD